MGGVRRSGNEGVDWYGTVGAGTGDEGVVG